MTTVKADSYTIFISANSADEINSFFEKRKGEYTKLFILLDENSMAHCYPQLVANVPVFEDAEIIEIESGEENKNIEICAQLWATLEELGADRQSLLINIGGGVIGDMGGFIASTYKRGISFVNIPTTLLAQVDASVGGKVGVDLNHFKNLIGVFNNPLAVFINTDFIQTQDRKQLLSGFAEIIKHALITDEVYWNTVKKADVVEFSEMEKIIEESVNIKNKVVLADPREKNIRKSLNFGHTVGHSIESLFLESGSPILHGEAIAAGMIVETWLSTKITSLSDESLNDITAFIASIYEPLPIEESHFERILAFMLHDKKNRKGQINFSLLSSIGKCEINQTASVDLIKEGLSYYRSMF
jgi:3-dehydroquinate synthase